MADDISSLLKEHHSFYEVSPYYVLLDERPLALPPTTRTVQAGFNVDVYGVRTDDSEPTMPPPQEYGLAYAELQKLAERASHHSNDSCSVEVIPFSCTAIIDSRNQRQMEAMIRIHISHERCLNKPAGLAEQAVLGEVERELKTLGIPRR